MAEGSFDYAPRTRTVFGEGCLSRIGELARELGFRRTLLVADPGIRATGYAERCQTTLRAAGIEVSTFHGFGANPTSPMVERGAEQAREQDVDSLIGLGGGSSLDCAKGINFIWSGGGSMRDYWGWAKLGEPSLPSIGIPTTAGTGSEAQSYALISDETTHVKMACGDPGVAFKVALLDPELTLTQPDSLTAVAGYDAVSHAVEAYVTTRRSALSDVFSRDAWRLLASHYERVLDHPTDRPARGAMLLGSHFAGIAIENGMLGATHACANPLSAHYGTDHGVAIAMMLPHVVSWNAAAADARYAELLAVVGLSSTHEPGVQLSRRLDTLARAGQLPRSLSAVGIPREDIPRLAEDAAQQWTGQFNPRAFDREGAQMLYERAYDS
jgi:alcohol dehydrogenase